MTFPDGREEDMEFLAGFAAIQQMDETLALRPKFRWAVRQVGRVPPIDLNLF
jgi:hypothetical protein